MPDESLKRLLRGRANRLSLEHPFHSLYEFATALIDDIVDHGQVRGPIRVIESPDELDDLPVGSVVRETDGLQRVWELNYVHIVGFERAGWWFTTGSKGSRLVQAIALPVEVLHIPNEEPADA